MQITSSYESQWNGSSIILKLQYIARFKDYVGYGNTASEAIQTILSNMQANASRISQKQRLAR